MKKEVETTVAPYDAEIESLTELENSQNYKERFFAEYRIAKIRCDKLHKMIVRYEAGKLDFKPTCPLALLKKQEKAMSDYLYTLEIRAQLEDIGL